ncbi:MAG TPA: hypothetical protein DCK95_08380 [Anaerolineaceae bacterium]|nr:hypothetical protein [Anaerolineaceae bacterium]
MKQEEMEAGLYRIVNIEQMHRLEQEADQSGLSFAQMMQNAGRGVGEFIYHRWKEGDFHSTLGLVGPGNNGGDTLVALTYLQEKGWVTRAYLLKDRDAQDELMQTYLQAGGTLCYHSQDEHFKQLDAAIQQADILLDGILGTGIQLPLRGVVKQVLSHLKERDKLPFIVAVDCPSGVDCESGEVDDAVLHADWTICIAAMKQGLLRFPAFEYVGAIGIVDIALPDDLGSWEGIAEYCVEQTAVRSILPKRPMQAHKGTFGTAVLFAGSKNYPGAAYLAAQAAYRIGTGLVQIATIPSVQYMLAGALPEATWALLDEKQDGFAWNASKDLENILLRATSLLIGPGWGSGRDTLAFYQDLLYVLKDVDRWKYHGVVLDADGLNLLCEIPDFEHVLPVNAILTPHPGEMARLTGKPIHEIQSDRISVVRKAAMDWKCVVVLKGALTVIAEPEGQVAEIPIATAALATAGSGDVLAGMLCGLLAQGMNPFDAACGAAWMHARAGVIAEKCMGHAACVLAGDVLRAIPDVMNELK